ncbi:MAG TPA: response regulator [Polyangia bacterium]|jgi:CheY-like chemotaxis protein|nr:response regulator [Polyangia bacterium]
MSTVIEAPSFITFVPPPTPKPASESSSSDRPSLQEPRRILLIEDDFMLRGSLSEFLQGEGYRVESAANGVDALRRLERPPRPALILLDIMLPYMDGLEFRAVQRATPDIADIPVIVITAVGVQPEVAKELDLRRRFFKPLDLPQLLAAIDQACPPLLS